MHMYTYVYIHTGTANENFAEFAVKRLENFIISISAIAHHIQTNNVNPAIGEAGRLIALHYATCLK